MVKSLTKMIMHQDMFGHHIFLNFNKNGTAHRTFLGGCFSLIVKVFLTFYIFTCASKLITHDDDLNISNL